MRLPELQFIDGQLERHVSQLANEAPTLFVVVPTVLSTSCISCDLGIVRRDGQKRSLRTTAPTRTIIPLRAILETPPAELRDHDNFLTRHVRMAGESVLVAAYGLER